MIVESPAKAKTIEKFLGKEFQVESSYGHIADLPSKEIGVDVENNFKPKYEVSPDKKALVKKLKDLSKNAETVWLASDEDREGEAISWHLAEELKLDPKKTKRIVFHEITKSAIQKAIENPRGINYDLVNAHQLGARLPAGRDVAHDALALLRRDERPEVVLRVQAGADPELVRHLAHAADDAVKDVAMHEKPGSSHAVLALQEERAPGDARDHAVEVRIGKHDHRGFSAELQRDPLEVAGGRTDDLLAHLGGPREGDLVHVGVSSQCRSCRFAEALARC